MIRQFLRMKPALLFLLGSMLPSAADITFSSPDGASRVVLKDQKILIETGGGVSQELDLEKEYGAVFGSGSSFLWSPDGSKLAASIEVKRSNDPRFYDIHAGKITEIALPDELDEKLGNLGPHENGKFYYLTPVRWVAGNKLWLVVSRNRIKEEGNDGEGEFEWWNVPVVLAVKDGAFELVSIGKKTVSDGMDETTFPGLFKEQAEPAEAKPAPARKDVTRSKAAGKN